MSLLAQLLRDHDRAVDPDAAQFAGAARITAVLGGNAYRYVLVDAAGADLPGTDGQATNIAVPAKALAVNDKAPLYARDGVVFFCDNPIAPTQIFLAQVNPSAGAWRTKEADAVGTAELPAHVSQAHANALGTAWVFNGGSPSAFPGHYASGIAPGSKRYGLGSQQWSFDVSAYMTGGRAIDRIEAELLLQTAGDAFTLLNHMSGGTFELRADANAHTSAGDFPGANLIAEWDYPVPNPTELVDIPLAHVQPDGTLHVEVHTGTGLYVDADCQPTQDAAEFQADVVSMLPRTVVVTGGTGNDITYNQPGVVYRPGDILAKNTDLTDTRQVSSHDRVAQTISLTPAIDASWQVAGVILQQVGTCTLAARVDAKTVDYDETPLVGLFANIVMRGVGAVQQGTADIVTEPNPPDVQVVLLAAPPAAWTIGTKLIRAVDPSKQYQIVSLVGSTVGLTKLFGGANEIVSTDTLANVATTNDRAVSTHDPVARRLTFATDCPADWVAGAGLTMQGTLNDYSQDPRHPELLAVGVYLEQGGYQIAGLDASAERFWLSAAGASPVSTAPLARSVKLRITRLRVYWYNE